MNTTGVLPEALARSTCSASVDGRGAGHVSSWCSSRWSPSDWTTDDGSRQSQGRCRSGLVPSPLAPTCGCSIGAARLGGLEAERVVGARAASPIVRSMSRAGASAARRPVGAVARAAQAGDVIATMPSAPTISGTRSAGLNPSSSACGVPLVPVLALIHCGDDGQRERPAELEGRVEQSAGEALLLGRDAVRRGDVERPEGEREAEAREQERRQHREPA